MKAMTNKQRQLMKIVVMGNLDATGNRVSNVDYTQVLHRLPYITTRDSLMCSVGILETQGWLVKAGKELRDGRMKQTLEPTAVAIRVISPPKPVAVPEYQEFDLGDDVIELVLV